MDASLYVTGNTPLSALPDFDVDSRSVVGILSTGCVGRWVVCGRLSAVASIRRMSSVASQAVTARTLTGSVGVGMANVWLRSDVDFPLSRPTEGHTHLDWICRCRVAVCPVYGVAGCGWKRLPNSPNHQLNPSTGYSHTVPACLV